MEQAVLERPATQAAGQQERCARAASARTADEQSAGRRNKALGARGEEAAARFLDRRGYDILERNWGCFAGEADIIAKDGDTVVFVEVKTRKDCSRGFPSEAVTSEKRSRYEKIALAYLADFDQTDFPVRFDVVAIVVMGPGKAMMRHHINAFSAVER